MATLLALAVSADAQELDRWTPGDCASFEAALLDCNTELSFGHQKRAASPISEVATAAGQDAFDEDLLSVPPAPAAAWGAIQISSQNW